MTTPEDQMEQDARMALKHEYRSQMQNYRANILTLVIGFFAGMEALRLLILPYWLVVYLFCVASGLLVAGVFYLVARAAWYGRLGLYVLRAAPTGLSRQLDSAQNTNTLVHRIHQGVEVLVKRELAGSCWDRLVRLGDVDPKNTSKLLTSSCIAFVLTIAVTISLFVLGKWICGGLQC